MSVENRRFCYQDIGMGENIPVNPVVLRWARETSGYSIEEVVEKIKRKHVTTGIVEDWESGKDSPSYSQLETLAYKIFKRPLALFFFPKPPEEETPRQFFRTLPQEELDLMEPVLLNLIRQAMVMRENLKELFDGVNPAQKKIFADIRIGNRSITSVSQKIRKYLGVNIEQQYSLKSDNSAFKYWRSLLEKHGIFTFKNAFKNDECSGFCLYDKFFPTIYINNSQPITRQIFTLFHELAHLLFRTGGVDFRHDDFIKKISGKNRQIEIFCNEFAGEFLVPGSDIKKHIHNKNIDDNLLSNIAQKYNVSREVILRKCLNLGYIDQFFYETKVKTWSEGKIKSKKSYPGGDYYRTKGVYLGEYYMDTAFAKFYKGDISKSQLADYLGTKETKVLNFEGYL